jgi:hypothetical protein
MQFYIILFASIVVAIILGTVIQHSPTTRGKLFVATISAIVGAIIPTLVYVEIYMGKFISSLQKNKYTVLEEKVSSYSSEDNASLSYKTYLSRLNNELDEAIIGNIKLNDEEEVIEEWKKLFDIEKEKSKQILATNIINPNFWLKESSFSKEQEKIQKEAINNDFIIKRILIYDANDKGDLRKELVNLANQQKSIGVEIKFLTIDDLNNNNVFIKNKSTIKGAEDFVVSDFNRVLMTISDPKSKTIKYGFISDDRSTVDIAVKIFNDLWMNSKTNIY